MENFLKSSVRRRVEAILHKGRDVLVGYKKGLKKGMPWFPGGGTGRESLVEAGKREALEETGMSSKKMERIKGTSPLYYALKRNVRGKPKGQKNKTYFVHGEIDTENKKLLDTLNKLCE